MTNIILFFIIFTTSCTSKNSYKNSNQDFQIHIVEKNKTKESYLTKQNLTHLFQVYELRPVIQSSTITIDSRSSAYPTFTITNKYAGNPHYLLSELLYLEARQLINYNKLNLKTLRSENTLAHFLEYLGMSHYLGRAESLNILKKMNRSPKSFDYFIKNKKRILIELKSKKINWWPGI